MCRGDAFGVKQNDCILRNFEKGNRVVLFHRKARKIGQKFQIPAKNDMMGPSKQKVEDEVMLTYDHQNTHARWAFTSYK